MEDNLRFSGSDTPIFGDGMIFYGSGDGQSELLAVRAASGEGNITDTQSPGGCTRRCRRVHRCSCSMA